MKKLLFFVFIMAQLSLFGMENVRIEFQAASPQQAIAQQTNAQMIANAIVIQYDSGLAGLESPSMNEREKVYAQAAGVLKHVPRNFAPNIYESIVKEKNRVDIVGYHLAYLATNIVSKKKECAACLVRLGKVRPHVIDFLAKNFKALVLSLLDYLNPQELSQCALLLRGNKPDEQIHEVLQAFNIRLQAHYDEINKTQIIPPLNAQILDMIHVSFANYKIAQDDTFLKNFVTFFNSQQNQRQFLECLVIGFGCENIRRAMQAANAVMEIAASMTDLAERSKEIAHLFSLFNITYPHTRVLLGTYAVHRDARACVLNILREEVARCHAALIRSFIVQACKAASEDEKKGYIKEAGNIDISVIKDVAHMCVFDDGSGFLARIEDKKQFLKIACQILLPHYLSEDDFWIFLREIPQQPDLIETVFNSLAQLAPDDIEIYRELIQEYYAA